MMTPEPPLRPGRWTRAAVLAARARTDLALALLDAILVVGGYTAALFVRFDGNPPDVYHGGFRVFLVGALIGHVAVNWAWGLYGQVWRYASVQEARRIVAAGATALIVMLGLGAAASPPIPRSVVVLGVVLIVVFHGGVRFWARLFAFHRSDVGLRVDRAVVVGAGDAGAALVREMLNRPNLSLHPVAILDDDPARWGRSISGVRIEGASTELREVATRTHADLVLLGMPSPPPEVVRRVAGVAEALGLPIKIVPQLRQLMGGPVRVQDVRDLEVVDLLGREQQDIDLEGVRRLLHGRTVLVTGGGGSIGSEIARQVAEFSPANLVLLDHDETHLHDVVADLAGVPHEAVLADVRDRRAVASVFARHRPHVVFHTAAHKHVPILERHPSEAVRTNVLGTRNVVEAARAQGVRRLVYVSTDKAAEPASLMGCSKWIGERIALEAAADGRAWCAVRFGNVMGSRGSVIPLFTRQIERGGPVTVTDPRMTRYFMSVTEAVRLVLQSAILSSGGEVFVLDMGEPVRILDLAERMIRLSGRRVGVDVPIRITGLRPGERLEESLTGPHESLVSTDHPAISRVARADTPGPLPEEDLDRLVATLATGDEELIGAVLRAVVAASEWQANPVDDDLLIRLPEVQEKPA